jgi:pyrimidine oxygenase
MQLTAEYGDYNFMIGGTLDDLTAPCDQLARAASKTGRTVGAYALFGIIAAATDEEAKSLADHYLAGTDREAIANQTATADGDKGGTIGTLLGSERPMTPPVDFPDDTTPALVQGACFMAPQLVGSYDRIAHYLNELETRLGIAGVILTFPDFPAGVTEFAEQVLPRVQAAAPAESH